MGVDRSTRLGWRPWIVPGLLIAVALVQISMATGDGVLTAAKGGGFGMFATVDRLRNRRITIARSDDPRTTRRAPILADMDSVKAYPSKDRFHRFLREYARQVDATGVLRGTVFVSTFDNATATVTMRPLRTQDVIAGQP